MTKSRPLPFAEFATDVLPAFSRVFASDDPFGEPFTKEMTHRAVLYNVEYDFWDEEAKALQRAALSVGAPGVYAFMTESPPQAHDNQQPGRSRPRLVGTDAMAADVPPTHVWA